MEKVISVPLAALHISSTNPRKHFSESSIAEMAQSLKSVGLIEPLVVRSITGNEFEFQIVCGERRYRAAVLAKLEKLLCVVKELNDDQVFEIQITENLQRENVNPLDECDAYHQLIKKGNTLEDLSTRFGRTTDYIYNRMRLINLNEDARQHLESGVLPITAAIKLSFLTEDQQTNAIKRLIVVNEVNKKKQYFFTGLRELKNFFDNNVLMKLEYADFSKTDKKLYPEAGPCTTCPKRTGQNLFNDIANKGQCLDSACFKMKHILHYTKLRQSLSEEKNTEVIFVARTWNAEKEYKELGSVIPVTGYDNFKKSKESQYAVYVGPETNPFEGEKIIDHGYIKLDEKQLKKQKTKQSKVQDIQALAKQEHKADLKDLSESLLKQNVFDHIAISKFDNDLSLIYACTDYFHAIDIPSEALVNFVRRNKLSIKSHDRVRINGGDWRNHKITLDKNTILGGNGIDIIHEHDFSFYIDDVFKAFKAVPVSKLTAIFNELVIIHSIQFGQFSDHFIKANKINLKYLKSEANLKAKEIMKLREKHGKAS